MSLRPVLVTALEEHYLAVEKGTDVDLHIYQHGKFFLEDKGEDWAILVLDNVHHYLLGCYDLVALKRNIQS